MRLIKAVVFHKRIWPKYNSFKYHCNYVSIKFPLENNKISFFSINKFNFLSLYEKDYANGNHDLFKWCSNLLKNKYNIKKIDNLELITMPRIFGYAFNPVSFIFCYSRDKVICTILKVNNTFSENHYYINIVSESVQNCNIEKLFHVSPFLPRDGHYKIKYKNNKNSIYFNIDYYNEYNKNILETYISGNKVLVKNSYMTIKYIFTSLFFITRVMYLIHYQALKLFFKKTKFYKKPDQNIKKIT